MAYLVEDCAVWGGDMAMYSEDPAAAAAAALDTSEEYCVPPSITSPWFDTPIPAFPPHSTGVYCTATGPECVRLWMRKLV